MPNLVSTLVDTGALKSAVNEVAGQMDTMGKTISNFNWEINYIKEYWTGDAATAFISRVSAVSYQLSQLLNAYSRLNDVLESGERLYESVERNAEMLILFLGEA